MFFYITNQAILNYSNQFIFGFQFLSFQVNRKSPHLVQTLVVVNLIVLLCRKGSLPKKLLKQVRKVIIKMSFQDFFFLKKQAAVRMHRNPIHLICQKQVEHSNQKALLPNLFPNLFLNLFPILFRNLRQWILKCHLNIHRILYVIQERHSDLIYPN